MAIANTLHCNTISISTANRLLPPPPERTAKREANVGFRVLQIIPSGPRHACQPPTARLMGDGVSATETKICVAVRHRDEGTASNDDF